MSEINIKVVNFLFEDNQVTSAYVEYSYRIDVNHNGNGNIVLDKEMLEKYGYEGDINHMVSVTTDYSKGLVSLIENAFKGENM